MINNPVFILSVLIIICITAIELVRDWKGRKSIPIELYEAMWQPIVFILKEFRSRTVPELINAIMVIIFAILALACIGIFILKVSFGGGEILFYMLLAFSAGFFTVVTALISSRYVLTP